MLQRQWKAASLMAVSFLIQKRGICGVWDAFAFQPSCRSNAIGINTSLSLATADNNGDNIQSVSNENESEDSSNLTGEGTDPMEGILLDPETYLKADSLIQPDGSLDLNNNPSSSIPRINNPLYQTAAAQMLSNPIYSMDEDEINTSTPTTHQSEDEMLLQAMRNLENNPQSIDPEILHQQVFAEEQTYLQQTEEFRKSLTSLYDDGVESPMARARREAINSYNDDILEKLMMDIDEMEKMAPTRMDALKQARAESRSNEHGLCSRCGCRVTPDVIERYQLMKTRNQRLEMICNACYGLQFRSNDEAKTRLGAGSYGYGDIPSAKMWDKKKTMKPRRSSDQAPRGKKMAVDTSFMFQMPKDSRSLDVDVETARRQLETMDSPADKVQQPRRRELGSKELTRRMIERKSELGSKIEDQATKRETRTTNRDELDSSETEWTRVIDKKSERTFFWNKSTGEMRKNLPE